MVQIPISHYKDEPLPTEDVVNQELEKEAEATVQTTTPELKVLPVKKQEKKPTKTSNIVNAVRQKMAMNTTVVELPSVGKTVEFKDIDGGLQKELSRVSIGNEGRPDSMYCAMVDMINKLAIDKTFNIRDYSEFERIAIILNLQQINKINPEIKFKCSKCGKENSYHLDTQKMLRDFNKAYREDAKIEIETRNRKYCFVVGWSNVYKIEDFFKNYYKKYDNSSKTVQNTMNSLSQIEYITMFVKKVTVTELSDPDDSITANLDELTYPERVQILDSLPQFVLFDEESGALSKIIENFINPMNDCFKYHDCSFCGAEQSGAMANLTDFMGY